MDVLGFIVSQKKSPGIAHMAHLSKLEGLRPGSHYINIINIKQVLTVAGTMLPYVHVLHFVLGILSAIWLCEGVILKRIVFLTSFANYRKK